MYSVTPIPSNVLTHGSEVCFVQCACVISYTYPAYMRPEEQWKQLRCCDTPSVATRGLPCCRSRLSDPLPSMRPLLCVVGLRVASWLQVSTSYAQQQSSEPKLPHLAAEKVCFKRRGAEANLVLNAVFLGLVSVMGGMVVAEEEPDCTLF